VNNLMKRIISKKQTCPACGANKSSYIFFSSSNFFRSFIGLRAHGTSAGEFSARLWCGWSRLSGVVWEEPLPSAVAVEGRKGEERLVAFQAPELARELEPALVLMAGGFDGA